MNNDFAGVQRMDEEIKHEQIIPIEPFPSKPPTHVYSPYPPTRGFKSKKEETCDKQK